MTTSKMLTSTWPFRKEKVEKTHDQKEKEDETQMENCYNLTFKNNITVFSFSIKNSSVGLKLSQHICNAWEQPIPKERTFKNSQSN